MEGASIIPSAGVHVHLGPGVGISIAAIFGATDAHFHGVAINFGFALGRRQLSKVGGRFGKLNFCAEHLLYMNQRALDNNRAGSTARPELKFPNNNCCKETAASKQNHPGPTQYWSGEHVND